MKSCCSTKQNRISAAVLHEATLPGDSHPCRFQKRLPSLFLVFPKSLQSTAAILLFSLLLRKIFAAVISLERYYE